MDWAFVSNNERAPPTCFKMDADLLESQSELNDLRKQCETFILNHAPRATHSERLCNLSRDAIREWVASWNRPLISEVCWTAAGLICKVSATVPHWADKSSSVFLTLLHNGSWCVCREMINSEPQIRKCVRDVKESGIYLSSWGVSQRQLGAPCSKHAVHFNSDFSWKLCISE